MSKFGPRSPEAAARNRENALLSRGGAVKQEERLKAQGKDPKLGSPTTNKGRLEIYAARERERIKSDKEMRSVFGDEEFEGDSYDFLTKIYKRPEFPIHMRVSAAETVIKYDRPSLNAVEVSGNKNNPLQVINTIMGVLNGTGRELPSGLIEYTEEDPEDSSSPDLEDQQSLSDP